MIYDVKWNEIDKNTNVFGVRLKNKRITYYPGLKKHYVKM